MGESEGGGGEVWNKYIKRGNNLNSIYSGDRELVMDPADTTSSHLVINVVVKAPTVEHREHCLIVSLLQSK